MERCSACWEYVELTPEGTIPHHLMRTADVSVEAMRELLETGRARPPILTAISCPGSGHISIEQVEGAQRSAAVEALRHRYLTGIVAARADAAVAHDAIESDRPWPLAEVVRLREFALIDYAVRFETSVPKAPWTWYRRGYRIGAEGAARAHALDERVIYCVFCRRLLVEGMPRTAPEWQVEQRTDAHTTLCALRCLAGIDNPVGPNQKPKRQGATEP
jgi:hypothetical protein